MFVRSSLFVVIASAWLVTGCERKPQPAQPSADSSKSGAVPHAGSAAKTDRAGLPAPVAGHSGEAVELGESTVNGMRVKASRDQGDLKPGGDAPIDIWLNGGVGDAAAVRFWIGTEDAQGSVKAKADVEAGHWHAHAEVPDPLPVESKLWVEIEAKDGKKSVASFGLSR